MYYGIKWTGGDVRQYVSIDAISGATNVLASITIPNHSVTPISAMAPGNNFYFLEQNNMTGYRVLFKADYASSTISATDSADSPYDITNLLYDCVQDSVIGFYGAYPYNVNGAEWIKVKNASGELRHTGTIFSGSGSLFYTGFTMLNGGNYYARNYYSSAIMFDPASTTGASYAPAVFPLNTLDLKLMSSPENIVLLTLHAQRFLLTIIILQLACTGLP